jgi:D-sedoheptulose 7-phosphate isomerase
VSTFSRAFLDDSRRIIERIDDHQVEAVVEVLRRTRERRGRLFLCGSGGGAGHASHAACDFRKLARIESYSITDNVSELTARINDDGWDSSYEQWLRTSRFRNLDCLFVFSVGGGDVERNVSVNLVRAMQLAQAVGASIAGVVGRDGGEVRRCADACVVVPTVSEDHVTAQTEGFQALLWHLMVSHPALDPERGKWESVTGATHRVEADIL